jgi:ADP-ribose pyrophosphatase YjhB (NUDIX family)
MKAAAVALVRRQSMGVEDYLVVWNRLFKTWALPGGKVEEGETPADACRRELREETGMSATTLEEVFSAPSSVDDTRMVHVFACRAIGVPEACEPDSPVGWMSHDALLRFSTFRPFYEQLFAAVRSRL